ncbi:hypothetical protein TIFTF001_035686 [Ficus carica]|uniref:Uncharacterized protein n=1 Tax=Ficus carica TaxID=3494 RepID=A0AA88J6S0_FICCA|nr:hypothetical protein TIFTF001_035686 [Ficus carica]
MERGTGDRLGNDHNSAVDWPSLLPVKASATIYHLWQAALPRPTTAVVCRLSRDPEEHQDETVNQPDHQQSQALTSTSAASNGKIQTFTLDGIPPSQ